MNVLRTAYSVSGAHAANRAASLESRATEAQAKPVPPISRALKAINNRIQSLVSATDRLLTREASRSAHRVEFDSNVSLKKITQINGGDFASLIKADTSKPQENFPPIGNRSWLHDVYVGSRAYLDTPMSSVPHGISTNELANELESRSSVGCDQVNDFDAVSHISSRSSRNFSLSSIGATGSLSDEQGVLATIHRPAVRIPPAEAKRVEKEHTGARIVGVHLKSDVQPGKAAMRAEGPDSWSWASGESLII
jgi:hypothetical protein